MDLDKIRDIETMRIDVFRVIGRMQGAAPVCFVRAQKWQRLCESKCDKKMCL